MAQTKEQHLDFKISALFAALTVSSMLMGCGSGDDADDTVKGSVAGTVTIAGKAFESGGFHITSTTNKSYVYGAEMSSGGKFTIGAPVPIGSYTVSLSPPPVGPKMGADGMPEPASAEDTKHNIPNKYLTAETSDKTVEIKEGDNTLTIELTP